MAVEKLVALLEAFVSGADQSQEFVRQEIGEALDEAFPGGEGFGNSAVYEELEIAVACYRPGGGQFMYDEVQMFCICTSSLRAIASHLSSG